MSGTVPGKERLESVASVSVVIPTFNYARFLSEALDSVLAQTYTDLEIIVVDGGSTDNTPEVLRVYGDRVRYIVAPSPVPNHSRNVGILASRGRFVALLDADDKWLPNKLARQVTVMESRPEVGLVYAGFCSFDSESGAIVGGSRMEHFSRGHVLKALYMRQFVPSPTPLIRRSVFEEVGLFDEATLGADDWEMWLRIAASYQFDFVEEYLALYRVHASNAGRLPLDIYAADLEAFFRQAAQRYPEVRPLLGSRLSILSESLGRRLIRQGMVQPARRRLRMAIKQKPSRLMPFLFLGYSYCLGRRIAAADWESARAADLQGDYHLGNLQRAEARARFAESIRASAYCWARPYLGWLSTIAGRRIAAWVSKRRGLGIYSGMTAPPHSNTSLEQW